MLEVKVLKEYPNSHHYFYEFKEEDSMFCPGCGSKSIWEAEGYGDYYLGCDYICTSCSHVFTYQVGGDETSIAKQLLSKTTDTPTTPKGN